MLSSKGMSSNNFIPQIVKKVIVNYLFLNNVPDLFKLNDRKTILIMFQFKTNLKTFNVYLMMMHILRYIC